MAESVPGSTRLSTSGGGLKAENTLGTRLRKRQAREKALKQPFIPLRFFLLFLCLGQVFSFITSSNLKQTRQAKNIKKEQKSSVRLSREAIVARFFQRQTDKPHVEHTLTIFFCAAMLFKRITFCYHCFFSMTAILKSASCCNFPEMSKRQNGGSHQKKERKILKCFAETKAK